MFAILERMLRLYFTECFSLFSLFPLNCILQPSKEKSFTFELAVAENATFLFIQFHNKYGEIKVKVTFLFASFFKNWLYHLLQNCLGKKSLQKAQNVGKINFFYNINSMKNWSELIKRLVYIQLFASKRYTTLQA